MSSNNVIDKIRWDIGTAYDLFISLLVLHNPSNFGVRPAWAAGMRQRLPTTEREFLEKTLSTIFHGPPLLWLAGLPDPKDSLTVIQALEALSPIERSTCLAGIEEPLRAIFQQIARQASWDQSQADACVKLYDQNYGKKLSTKAAGEKLDGWAAALEAGERFPAVLRVYHEVFFAEEERRIVPYLEQSLAQARRLAEGSTFSELMLELSQGVRYDEETFTETREIILAPSFWSTPTLLIHPGKHTVMTFGARPAGVSLIPGEPVPDGLLAGLTGLSDPTRLRILRYLKTEQLTPTQLATRLRLRAPTVVHHLKILRNAGLVTLISSGMQKETIYELRQQGLEAVWDLLTEYFRSREKS